MKLVRAVLVVPIVFTSFLVGMDKPTELEIARQKAQDAAKQELEHKQREEQLQTEERKRVDQELKLREQQQREVQNPSEVEKQKSEILQLVNQFEDAYRHYTAGRIKEGDAALLKIDGKALLDQLSVEQLANIISTLKPQPEMRFMILGQLADVNAQRGTLVSERPTLIRLITGFLGSLQSDDFQKLFADKKMVQGFARIIDQLKSLIKKPVHFVPELPAEELFYEIMSTAQRLVVVVKTAPAQQKKRCCCCFADCDQINSAGIFEQALE